MRSTTTSMSCGNFLSKSGLPQLVEGAVDLDALKALLEIFGELLLVLALAAAHDGASR